MNFGYLIVCKQHNDVDYINLAYALALSIKTTQKHGYDKVALVLEDMLLLDNIESSWVFDEIIVESLPAGWDGRSNMDLYTPWEATVCLDADMIFLRDYSHWIDYFLDNCELYIPSCAYTYRGEQIIDDYYRKTFTANHLPNLYSFFTFFRLTKSTKVFFDLQREILQNSKSYSNIFLSKHKPKIIGTDEAFALSAKILGIEDSISYNLAFPKVVHFKPMVQNWPWPANKSTNHVGFYVDKDANLKIGNYQQNDIVHYVEKDLMTREIVSILEHKAWQK